MPITWNEQADAKLLVSILQQSKPRLDYDALAKCMGPDCTRVAVQTRISRLKKRADKLNGDGHDGDDDGDATSAPTDSAPTTPSKRKRGSRAESAKDSGTIGNSESPKGAKKSNVKIESGDEDDAASALTDSAPTTPSKRKRNSKAEFAKDTCTTGNSKSLGKAKGDNVKVEV